MDEAAGAQADASKVAELGWRQGSVLPASLLNKLQRHGKLPKEFDTSSDVLVVVSQDCDVCNSRFDSEPWAELIVAKAVPEIRKQYRYGKHPRFIEFEAKQEDETLYFASSAHNRLRIDRRELALHSPRADLHLSPRTVRDMKHWIARRYIRDAFPDEFERRISKQKRRFEDKIFKKAGKGGLFTAIFVLTSEDELSEAENYEVILWLTMTTDDYESQENREAVEKLAGQIANTMQECEGIEVTDYEVKSEADMSLDDRRSFKRWDYDALSFAEDLPTIKED